jgi:hypothetical protein
MTPPKMEKVYSISKNGDWLEKEAADFIKINIPSYELIWRIFIGNTGNAKIAKMAGIKPHIEEKRVNFSQHLYTILESLYFMQKIREDESDLKQILGFNDYRKALNQLISFQAYSGRLRDNIISCFLAIGSKQNIKKIENRFEKFYHSRNIFVHGRKVPLSMDRDKLFRIAKVKDFTTSIVGFGMEMPWENISTDETIYIEDAYSNSMNELIPIVEKTLSNLLVDVKRFNSKYNLDLIFEWVDEMQGTHTSGVSSPIIFNVSGSIGI